VGVVWYGGEYDGGFRGVCGRDCRGCYGRLVMMRVFDEVSWFLVLDLRGESNNWGKMFIVPIYPTSP